jgi:carbonic anhydrase/acetyltransferase-like protein (isoleucine patch superfamily)
VNIGAILTLASGQNESEASDSSGSKQFGWRSLGTIDVLGASLLQRTQRKLEHLGSLSPRVLTESNGPSQFLPSRSSRSTAFVEEWERAVAELVHGGADILILGRISAYTDIDYTELLQYHAASESLLTQAYAGKESLDVAVVSAKLLRTANGAGYRSTLSSAIPQQKRFCYSGYVNWLRNVQDLHTLMQDALYQRCGLQPVGREVSPGVWLGESAVLDPTVLMSYPVYIGARSRVGSGCRVASASSIERDCHIDCGTTVRDSLVLPQTYIGLGLELSRAVAGPKVLFHVDRNVEVNIRDARLIGRTSRSLPFLSSMASLITDRWSQ